MPQAVSVDPVAARAAPAPAGMRVHIAMGRAEDVPEHGSAVGQPAGQVARRQALEQIGLFAAVAWRQRMVLQIGLHHRFGVYRSGGGAGVGACWLQQRRQAPATARQTG